MLRWLWPAGLAGRIALVLGVMLIGVQLITLPFFLRQQSTAAAEIFQGSTVDRVAAIIELFEPLSAPERRELLPAVSSPFLSLDMFYGLTVSESAALDEPQLAASLSARLQREVIIKQVDEEPGGFPALLSTRQRIAIWVPLVDDSWLRFSTRSALPSMGWVVHMSAQLLLVCLALLLVALVAARQITRPIRTFVAATERLGTDVNAPPIPEQGSRELRRVTRVFNTMQDRPDGRVVVRHLGVNRSGFTALQLRQKVFVEGGAGALRVRHPQLCRRQPGTCVTDWCSHQSSW